MYRATHTSPKKNRTEVWGLYSFWMLHGGLRGVPRSTEASMDLRGSSTSVSMSSMDMHGTFTEVPEVPWSSMEARGSPWSSTELPRKLHGTDAREGLRGKLPRNLLEVFVGASTETPMDFHGRANGSVYGVPRKLSWMLPWNVHDQVGLPRTLPLTRPRKLSSVEGFTEASVETSMKPSTEPFMEVSVKGSPWACLWRCTLCARNPRDFSSALVHLFSAKGG